MPDQDVEFTESWQANSNTKYTVNHFIQDGSSYKLYQTEDKEGVTDSIVKITPLQIDGYSYSYYDANINGELVVLGDGSLVINLYYNKVPVKSNNEQKQSNKDDKKVVNTGDDTNLWMYVYLLLVSAGLIPLLKLRKKYMH